MGAIKLISFDVTNTLLKFKSSVGSTYSRVAAGHGLTLAPDVEQSFRKNFKLMSKAQPTFGRGTIGCREWWRQVVGQTFEDCGFRPETKADRGKLQSMFDQLYESYTTDENWHITDEAREVLRQLEAAKYRLIVISNFDERLKTLLKNQRIDSYFERVVSCYDVGFSKPHPEIFRRALEGGSDLTAGQCLHIGDDLEKDYLGALNAGWQALLYSEQDVEDGGVDRDCIVRNLSDIPAKVRCLDSIS